MELADAELAPCVALLPSGRSFALSGPLAALLSQVDGARRLSEVAQASGLQAQELRLLVQQRLAPAGLVGLGTAPPAPAVRSPLWLRLPLVPARLVDALARPLALLFRRPLLQSLLALGLLAQLWLAAQYLRGHGAPLPERVLEPGLWGRALLLTLAATLLHELGHAAALRAAGERPGPIGAGMLLFFPVAYADVTRAWRLDRRARVRVDLGGVYLEFLLAAALALVFALRGGAGWAWAVLLVDVGILESFHPWLRLDGYWLLADLSGVPDLQARAGRLLLDALRGRRRPQGRAWLLLLYALTAALFLAALAAAAALWLLPRTLAEMRSAAAALAQQLQDGAGFGTLLAAGVPLLLGALVLLGMLAPLLAVLRRLRRPRRDLP